MVDTPFEIPDDFPFTVSQDNLMAGPIDELYLRFHFREGLPSGNVRRINELITDWNNGIPDEFCPEVLNEFRFTKGRRISCWLYMDIGVIGPDLSPYLTDLIRRVNDFAPLELVEITNDR